MTLRIRPVSVIFRAGAQAGESVARLKSGPRQHCFDAACVHSVRVVIGLLLVAFVRITY